MIYLPFKFDKTAPYGTRVYEPAVNVMEGSTIAYSKEKAFWATVGMVNNKGSNFIYNEQVGFCQTSKWDGCLKVHEQAQGGNNCSWEDSVIIGKDNQYGWTIYDGGIYVKNSRVAWQKSSGGKFLWAQPNVTYGGNGNDVILEGTGPLGLFDGDKQRYAWVFAGFQSDNIEWITEPVEKLDNIVSYSRYFVGTSGKFAWDGYIMSVDNAWVHGNKGTKEPNVLATTNQMSKGNVQGWGYGAHSMVGSQALSYMQGHAPTFICNGAGSYGNWCDATGSPDNCSAYIAFRAGHWETTIAALAGKTLLI